jgi:hypothetical protein
MSDGTQVRNQTRDPRFEGDKAVHVIVSTTDTER